MAQDVQNIRFLTRPMVGKLPVRVRTRKEVLDLCFPGKRTEPWG